MEPCWWLNPYLLTVTELPSHFAGEMAFARPELRPSQRGVIADRGWKQVPVLYWVPLLAPGSVSYFAYWMQVAKILARTPKAWQIASYAFLGRSLTDDLKPRLQEGIDLALARKPPNSSWIPAIPFSLDFGMPASEVSYEFSLWYNFNTWYKVDQKSKFSLAPFR